MKYSKLIDCPSAKYTDKGSSKDHGVVPNVGNGYLDVYDFYFSELRDKNINFLEIGISLDHSDPGGSSLWMWKEYFHKSNIYGLDIDPACKCKKRDGITVYIGNQNDPEILSKIIRDVDGLDVVIDDGSHVNKHIITSFEHLFKHINPGGYYIIEDLGNSSANINQFFTMWPGMKHNDPNEDLRNDKNDMDNFFIQLIDAMNSRQMPIGLVHFWYHMCVVKKI